jgi:outer membrane protein OmpA-like peptidoglycan-associated protein
MRCSAILLSILLVACGSNAKRSCTPIPSFSAPAGECVALAEAPKPPPPKPIEKPPEPEPEPEPEPPKPEPEPEPPPPVVVTADKIELDRTVQFESGKAKLVEDSKTLLGDVAKVLTEHDEILLVQVEGHTDAVGSSRKNKKLSDQRAKAVRAFLIAAGINKKRLVAKGFGKDKPVADNGTEEGRFKNRRVDLKILKRDESKMKKSEDDEKKPSDEPKAKKSEDEPKAKKAAADEDDDEADEEAEKPVKKKPKPKAKKK